MNMSYRTVIVASLFCTTIWVPTVQAQKIYWSQNGTHPVARANLDGSELEAIVTNALDDPLGIVVDPTDGRVYWTDKKFLRSSNQYGTDIRVVYEGTSNLRDLALIPSEGLLFFSQGSYIARVATNGSSYQTIINLGGNCGAQVAADSTNLKVYWADCSDMIHRANLDGTEIETIQTGLVQLRDLQVDSTNQLLFWSIRGTGPARNQIWQSSLLGDDAQMIYFNEFGNSSGGPILAIDPQRHFVYANFDYPENVSRIAYDGSEVVAIAESQLSEAMAINVNNQQLFLTYHYGDIKKLYAPTGQSEAFIVDGFSFRATEITWAPELGKIVYRTSNRWGTFGLGGSDFYYYDPSNIPALFGLAVDRSEGSILLAHSTFPYPYNNSDPRITRLDLEGNELQVVLENDTWNPTGIAVDSMNGHVYWTEASRIRRSDIDGENIITLPITELWTPVGITVDVIHGKIYWAEGEPPVVLHPHRIRRANLDGTEVELLSSTGGHGITVDPVAEKLYWTNSGSIYRSNLDGSSMEILFQGSGSTTDGVAVDTQSDQLYWAGSGKIWRSNLDGSQSEIFLNEEITRPTSIAVDPIAGKLYWCDLAVR